MLAERGISVDHSTIYRWVQCYAPEMEKRALRWFWRRGFDPSWRLVETYVKGAGARWTYLYRAVDKRGDTIRFLTVADPHAKAAKAVPGQGPARPEALGKVLPRSIPTKRRAWCSDHRIEARRKAGPETAHAGEVSQ
jgi:hypothetical protein